MSATDDPPQSRTVLITGGSRGIGAATARLAARRGYRVALTYMQRKAAAQEVVAGIEAAGGTALAIQTDVSQESNVLRLFAAIDRRFGRLTALVNNAGILERQARVQEMDAARLTRILATNVTGSFLCAREAILRMAKSRGGAGGAIVNVSSMAARLGSPHEYVDYAASKGAIDAFTIGLAREVAAARVPNSTLKKTPDRVRGSGAPDYRGSWVRNRGGTRELPRETWQMRTGDQGAGAVLMLTSLVHVPAAGS